ncbi:hypothetical protein D3C87_2087050 [compost metagenome]
MKVYKNGSTAETVYSDSKCTIKLGSLNKYEQCDSFGIFNGVAMVRYQIANSGNYKIGFVKWTGGVK